MLLTSRRLPPVYRLRAGQGTDSYGDPVEDWTTPDRLKLRLAQVQDVSSVEEEGQTKRILRGERLLVAPGHVDVKADDRIEVAAEVWRVNGEPSIRKGLASSVVTSAALVRVEGGALG